MRNYIRRSYGAGLGKLLSLAKRRRAVRHVRQTLGEDVISKLRACRALGHSGSTQRCKTLIPDDEPQLVKEMVELATQYGRYAYRRITGLLSQRG